MTLLQISIDYKIPLWGIILYVLGQIGAFYWFIDRLSKTTEANRNKNLLLEEELKELKLMHKTEMTLIKEICKEQNSEIRELRDIVIQMKAVMDLKVLSELKITKRGL